MSVLSQVRGSRHSQCLVYCTLRNVQSERLCCRGDWEVFLLSLVLCSNKTSCSKIAMRLKVLRREDPVQDSDCPPPLAAATSSVVIPQQDGKDLDCPDLQHVTKMADSDPHVTWYHVTLTGAVIRPLSVSCWLFVKTEMNECAALKEDLTH